MLPNRHIARCDGFLASAKNQVANDGHGTV
jgi:hypothetical protein